QREAPELLPSDDARDRLTGKATRRERLDGGDLLSRERPCRCRYQPGVTEVERVASEHPRVEVGRAHVGAAKRIRERAARRRDGRARPNQNRRGSGAAHACGAASNAACCSVISASTTSPSASPATICGSLYRVRLMR